MAAQAEYNEAQKVLRRVLLVLISLVCSGLTHPLSRKPLSLALVLVWSEFEICRQY